MTGIQFRLSLELDILVFVFLSLDCTLTLLISIITVHKEGLKFPALTMSNNDINLTLWRKCEPKVIGSELHGT